MQKTKKRNQLNFEIPELMIEVFNATTDLYAINRSELLRKFISKFNNDPGAVQDFLFNQEDSQR